MTQFRDVVVDGNTTYRKDAGPRPALTWLPISDLVVDTDYQRPLGRGNWQTIAKIAASFEWAHFSPCVVAPAGDGKYSIIDGQHRCHAALMAGQHEVPCLVSDLCLEAQAKAFSAINGVVTAVSVFHLYRAALVSREAWAVTSHMVVNDAGCRLMTSHASSAAKKAGQIYCVGLIKSFVVAGHGALITAGLKAIWSSRVASDASTWNYGLLKPWLHVLKNHPRALTRDLSDFVAKHDLVKTHTDVELMRTQDAYKGKTRIVLFNAVLEAQMVRWLADGGGKS